VWGRLGFLLATAGDKKAIKKPAVDADDE